jgi:hypothetical protein
MDGGVGWLGGRVLQLEKGMLCCKKPEGNTDLIQIQKFAQRGSNQDLRFRTVCSDDVHVAEGAGRGKKKKKRTDIADPSDFVLRSAPFSCQTCRRNF